MIVIEEVISHPGYVRIECEICGHGGVGDKRIGDKYWCDKCGYKQGIFTGRRNEIHK
jgi:transposase